MPTTSCPRVARLHLFRAGAPRYIRCYDDGCKSAEPYTVVFTGRYRGKTGGAYWYVGMNAYPFAPQGIGQHGESGRPIDWPRSSHLGRRVPFAALPEDCRRLVLVTYCDLWDALPPGLPVLDGVSLALDQVAALERWLKARETAPVCFTSAALGDSYADRRRQDRSGRAAFAYVRLDHATARLVPQIAGHDAATIAAFLGR